MNKDSRINILIACHKESELPKSEVFLPVQVGSAIAAKDLGIQRDDDGDNISDKNGGYCELTAIYWAWKNLDSDYYGLFHYRRFYSFSDKRFNVSDDGHMMVRAQALSSEVFDKYGLNDTDKIKEIIGDNDIIVHESRPVSEIPTPMGISGATVLEHYLYHDGTIINTSDLELIRNIIRDKYPEVFPYYEKYLNGSKFLGYNMFVMRREYFDSMCDFLFGVLFESEKTISGQLADRSLNSNRIYGYLAEILTSAYIYYLRSTRNLRVRELQMIYALKTDKYNPIKPVNSDEVTIVYDMTTAIHDKMKYFAYAVLKRLVKSCSRNKKYRILVFQDNILDPYLANRYQNLSTDNVKVSIVNYSDYLDRYREQYEIPNIGLKLVVPWILERFSNAVLINWNSWFNVDPADLAVKMVDLPDGKHLLAAQNMYRLGQHLEVNGEHQKSLYAQGVAANLTLSKSKYFSDNVMAMDLEAMRQRVSLAQIIKVHARLSGQFPDEIILNHLYSDRVALMDQKWNYQLASNDHVNYIGNFYAPINIFKSWKSIANSNISIFNPDDLGWSDTANGDLMGICNVIFTSELAPMLMLSEIPKPSVSQGRRSLRQLIAPRGSKREKVVKTILPPGSGRSRAVRRCVNLVRRKK